MAANPQWCTVCQSGPTRSLGAVHAWCTNCGALYDEHGKVDSLPTKIGPDPKERREAWDQYAAAHGAQKADALLIERDARYSPKPKEPTNG